MAGRRLTRRPVPRQHRIPPWLCRQRYSMVVGRRRTPKARESREWYPMAHLITPKARRTHCLLSCSVGLPRPLGMGRRKNRARAVEHLTWPDGSAIELGAWKVWAGFFLCQADTSTCFHRRFHNLNRCISLGLLHTWRFGLAHAI